jgi:FlaA1/EpsC-like NDP-sugar epimerase
MRLIPDRNTPRWVIFVIDMGLVLCSLLFAYLIRFDFLSIPYDEELPALKLALPIFIIIRALSFYIGKTYLGIVRYTSTQDGKRIFVVVTIGSLIFALLSPIRFHFYDGYYFLPLSIILIDYLMTLFIMFTGRIAIKLIYLESKKSGKSQTKVLIYGAGEAGNIAKRTLDRDLATSYTIVAFVDDNEAKSGKKIDGAPIIHSSKLDEFLSKREADQMVVSIQNPNVENKRRVIETCLNHQVEVLNVPPVSSWINGELSYKQFKKVKIEDLLGRKPIRLDNKTVQEQLENKVVLVTGAAGSIGSGIVKQIIRYKPKKLLLLDQAESPLHELEVALRSTYSYDGFEVIIGDIRNKDRMENVFETFGPEIVYHAAAYKHVPLMEENPSEAILTNVKGTGVLVDLAVAHNVSRFVMISTDKAVNPTSVMGASKRIAEIYAQAANGANNTLFITTRFGNVLGSNGSVIPLFKRQIEEGGPVTVTHQEVTRFFMTIPEACQLVLEAGAMGEGGEVFVFDMGQSVKIIDLARKMIQLSGLDVDKDIRIEITGLRPGEKLFEEVLSNEENTLPTHHPQILIAKVREQNIPKIKVSINELIELFDAQNNTSIVGKMKEIVPEYKSNNSVFSKLDA